MSLLRDCLKGTIVNSQDPEVSCPDSCDSKILDREIKEVSARQDDGRRSGHHCSSSVYNIVIYRFEFCAWVIRRVNIVSASIQNVTVPHG